MKKKVLLGMSGGVDSSVAAILLLNQGYDVTGVTMKLRPDEYMSGSQYGGCCSLDDVSDARRVAYKLGIDHLVMNFTDIFKEKVIDYFVNEYINGRTPNPCMACNQYVKFDAMLNRAVTLGFDYIATGHYANIVYDEKISRWLLKKSESIKDQSYFLYGMTQDQLSRTLFPLSNYDKSEIRKIAVQHELNVASKPDSQEICFVENNDHSKFIENYTNQKIPVGNFIDSSGKILGKHKGITNYTIGQRKGLGIALGKHMFVTKIDASNNSITLGEYGSQYSSYLTAKNLNFIPFDCLKSTITLTAKIRYHAKPVTADIIPISNDRVQVNFKEPQKSVTPGQYIVFYDGDVVIGGGIIE